MATQEVIRDQPARPQAPVDENVIVPAHVRQAAERAAEIHAQAYPQEQPAESEAQEISPQPDPEAQEISPQPDPAAAPEPQPDDEPPESPSREEIQNNPYAARYNSMKGRYDKSQKIIEAMQTQMAQLGDELQRTQALITQPRPEPRREPPPEPTRHLTPQDEETFGTDFIDVARRAALDAIASSPDVTALKRENQALKQRVNRSGQLTVNQILDQEVPDWRALSATPQFQSWVHSRDIYSGVVRKKMLDAAYQAADAPRVAAFFKGFLNEGQATGYTDPAPQPEQPVRSPPPRQAAVPLTSLAAPGRARTAAGGSSVPADKPVFTRQQIADFYSPAVRKSYEGRETERRQHEEQLYAAQREGRIR